MREGQVGGSDHGHDWPWRPLSSMWVFNCFVFNWFFTCSFKIMGHRAYVLGRSECTDSWKECMISHTSSVPLIHPTWMPINSVQPRGCFLFSWFDIGINFKDPNLVYLRSFEMNQQQIYCWWWGGQVFMLNGWEVCSYMIVPSLSQILNQGGVVACNCK